MELAEALKRAAQIVEEAQLPSDLRAAAFSKAVDSLVGPASPAPSAQSSGSAQPGTHSGVSGLLAVSQKLGVTAEVADEVYDLRDGRLDVILGFSRIAAGAAAGARQLAVLVAAGRQAIGIDGDGWTPVSEIRDICKEFNKFDSANFASTIVGMDQWFSVSGSGPARKIRLTRAGWEHAAQLIAELVQ
jgi:hypothetical protein